MEPFGNFGFGTGFGMILIGVFVMVMVLAILQLARLSFPDERTKPEKHG